MLRSSSQKHMPLETSGTNQIFEFENSEQELENPFSMSNLPWREQESHATLQYIYDEKSFVLRKDIEPENLSVYETLISNPFVLNYLRTNRKKPTAKNEYLIVDSHVPVIKDYFHALLFLSHEFKDLQQDFRWLRRRYPMYNGHRESFETFLIKDKVFLFECTKMMLKYEEDNLLLSMYYQYVKSHQLLIKSVIELFFQFQRHDLLKKILGNLLGNSRFETCNPRLRQKFIKVLIAWTQHPDSEPLENLLQDLKIDPVELIEPAIRTNIFKITSSLIKIAGISYNDELFENFIAARRYDFFLFCDLKITFKFVISKLRAPKVVLSDIRTSRKGPQHRPNNPHILPPAKIYFQVSDCDWLRPNS